MADAGHDETERLIKELEKKIRREYKQAVNDAQEKLSDYLRRFEIKDEKWKIRLANGDVTAAEYAAWRQQQIMVGAKWEALRNELATDLHNAEIRARNLIRNELASAYASNFNYATYLIEKAGKVNTSFTLYSKDAVDRILKENPDILPAINPGSKLAKDIADGKAIAWQEGQIQSVTLQSIVQGESIPNMVKRIANTMGDRDHAATIRYARTAITSAQNAGRQDAFERAEALGVKMKKQWLATLDNRTRHEHRILDGQTKPIDEPFEVDGMKIDYPGDIAADPALVWNCRCTMTALVDGWEDKSGQLRDASVIGDYDEWKEGHSQPDSITKQEDIADIMKRYYINELYGDTDN